jgi:alpha-galactosidase
MKKSKIVLIGSGSQYTEFFLQEIFKYEDFKGCTLTMVDRKKDRLDMVLAIAKKFNDFFDWDLTVEGFTDRRDALSDANVVYCFAAVNYKEAWKKEYEICVKNGLNPFEFHTNGPGGLGMAIRHVPLILDICSDMEELCPDAWLIIDSNPLAKMQAAVARYSKIKCIGYCYGHELVQLALEQILGMTDRAPEQMEADPLEREFMVPAGTIDIHIVGVNHMGWLLDIKSAATGEDLYPKLRKILDETPTNKAPMGYRFCTEVYRRFGYFASPGDQHVADYAWFFDSDMQTMSNLQPFVVDAWFGGRDRDAWGEIYNKVNDIEAAKLFIKQIRAGWMSTQISRYLISGGYKYFPSINVVNNGAIADLSDDIIVEVPGIIGPDLIKPIQMGELPYGLAPICQLHGSISNIVADAAATGSKEKALQALLLDPFICSQARAQNILDDILEYNKEYDTRF